MTSPQPPSPRGGPKCGARDRGEEVRGKPCQLPAGWGTDHVGVGQCRKHFGNAPNNVAAARKVQAEQAAQRFGVRVETTAEEALLDELYVSRGVVEFYRARVAALTPDQMTYGSERVTRTRRPDGDAAGGQVVEDTTVLKSRASVWIGLLQQAEAHHLEVAATIVKLGIAARRVELEREQVRIAQQVVLVALQRLAGISPDDPRVARELPAIVREIAG